MFFIIDLIFLILYVIFALSESKPDEVNKENEQVEISQSDKNSSSEKNK